MSPAAFLLIALVVGVIGSVIVVSRNRTSHRPDFAMDEFRREMEALAPMPPHTPNEARTDSSRLAPFVPKARRAPLRPLSLDELNLRPDEPGRRDSSRLGGRFGPEPDSRPSAGSDAR